jgi:hypothetical protein
MRILLLSVSLLVAALLQGNSTPASAAGTWCYLNETEHCGEVSFETCHFGTHGNGGYCYPNPSYRSQTRGRTEAHPVSRRNQSADHLAFAGYRQPAMVWHGDMFRDWNTNQRDHRRSNRNRDDWSFSADYGFEPKAKVRKVRHHRHHHKKSRRAVASLDMIPTLYDGLAAIALALHGQSEDAIKAFAFASPSSIPSTSSVDLTPVVVVPTALPKGFPNIDFARSCRAASQIGVSVTQGSDGCRASETEARDQLAKDWSLFKPSDRSSCTNLATMGGGGTYTSLLTCLELKRDVALLQRKDNGSTSIGMR